MLEQILTCTAVGTPAAVHAALREFQERTGADELMISCQIFDHAARLRSYEIVAEAIAQPGEARQYASA
jgi:alkanesulfonate monooxygenase SsuD/methylene tetrahydromethanopterin reductase-like flavin-dependent oxidoreductase (luciferase family)